MKDIQQNRIVKTISIFITVIYLFNTVAIDYGYCLQPSLRLADRAFMATYQTQYALEWVDEITQKLEENISNWHALDKTLESIERKKVFTKEDFQALKLDFGAFDGERIIKIAGDIIIRYCDSTKIDNIPEGYIHFKDSEKYYGNIVRQVLYSRKLQDTLIERYEAHVPGESGPLQQEPQGQEAGSPKKSAKGKTMQSKASLVQGTFRALMVIILVFLMALVTPAKGSTALNFSLGSRPKGQMRTGARNIISSYKLINYGLDTLVAREPHIKDIPGGKAADIFLLRLPIALYSAMLQHEYYGHGARAREQDLSVSYKISPERIFDGGYYYKLKDKYPSRYSTEELSVITGGMSAGQVLADEIRDEMFAEKSKYHMGLLYASAKLNLTKNVLFSSQPLREEYYTGRSDIKQYWNRMEGRYDGDPGFSWRDMQKLAVWNLMDPTIWYSLYGIAEGRESIELPPVWPYTGADFTPIGPEGYLGVYVRGDAIMDNPPFSFMKVGLRKGRGPEGKFYGVAAQLNDIDLTDSLAIKRLSANYFRQQGKSGGAFEVGLERQLTDNSFLTFSWMYKDKGYVSGMPFDKGNYITGGLRIDFMKPLGLRKDTELDFSSRHNEFEDLAEFTPIENVYGIEAKVIQADLGKDAQTKIHEHTGSCHFFSERYKCNIIVLNSKNDKKIQDEAKFHEAKEIQWMRRDFSQHEAHVVATAEQIQRFSKGSFTPYHLLQLQVMTPEQRNAIQEEGEDDRTWHHETLEKANESGAYIDIHKIKNYEKNLRSVALVLPETFSINTFLATSELVRKRHGAKDKTFTQITKEFITGEKDALIKIRHSDKPVLVRIPDNVASGLPEGQILQFCGAPRDSNIYFAIYNAEFPDRTIRFIGEEFPDEITRQNTITLYATSRDVSGRELQATIQINKMLQNSIIVPIGSEGDQTGIIRGTLFGLRLIYIARNKNSTELQEFVQETIEKYRNLIISYGITPPNLTQENIMALAVSTNVNSIVRALLKVIATLPIRPIPIDEIHDIYKHAISELGEAV